MDADEARQQIVKRVERLRGERESLPKQIELLKQSWRGIEDGIAGILDRAARALGEPLPRETLAAEGEARLKALAALLAQAEAQGTAAAQAVEKARATESAARDRAARARHEFEMARQAAEAKAGAAEAARARVEHYDERLSAWPRLAERLEEQRQAKAKRDSLDRQRADEDRLRQQFEQKLMREQSAVAAGLERERALDASLREAASEIQRLDPLCGDFTPDALDARRRALQNAAAKLDTEAGIRQSEILLVERQIAEAAVKRAQLETVREEAAVYHELGSALEADQFQAFVQREALSQLACDGARHLRQLSDGRYSFTLGEDGQTFQVVDHQNADETRPVTTLSGGESFLASLSLALALSESLSEYCVDREKLVLESLFLDEGFSTLDLETLDTVVGAIESLAGGKRLIGVISHVPDLAERLPARVHVRKGVGGSTVARCDG
jgi:exonuclease SbcC